MHHKSEAESVHEEKPENCLDNVIGDADVEKRIYKIRFRRCKFAKLQLYARS